MKAGTPLEAWGFDWLVEGMPEIQLFGAGLCSWVMVKSFRILPDPLAFRLLFCCVEGADGEA